MKTINKTYINQIVIKNSKFISIIEPINEDNNILDIINKYKKIYPKATHYTYAYILNDYKKQSDDNEPSNTAGRPMLNILEKENLVNILAITIRYFGGIKLGIGPLARAYQNSLKEVLKCAELTNIDKKLLVKVFTDFNKQELENLNNVEIINREYDNNNIIYTLYIKEEDIEILNNYKYEILKKTYH